MCSFGSASQFISCECRGEMKIAFAVTLVICNCCEYRGECIFVFVVYLCTGVPLNVQVNHILVHAYNT